MKRNPLLILILSIVIPVFYSQTPEFQFGHRGSILHIKFSPDGSKLLTYSSGNQDLCLWDVQSGRLLWKRPIGFIQKADEYYTLNSFAWSPDQRIIATASANGTVQLWKAETGDFIWLAEATKGDLAAVAFSPDGRTVAAVPFSDETTAAKLFDVTSGKAVKVVAGDKCSRLAAAFDTTGQELKIGNLDGNVSVASVVSDKPALKQTTDCRTMYAYGGQRSFSEDLSLSVRRTKADEFVIEEASGKVLRREKFNDSRMTSLINSKARLAVVSEYGGFHLYNLESGEDKSLDDCFSGNAVDLSRDGKLFAQSCDGFRTRIKVTKLSSGEVLLLDGHPSRVNALSYSPDYKTLAIAGTDGNIYLFDPITRSPVRSFNGNENRVTAVAFSPDGKTLVSGDEGGVVKLWEIESGKLLKETNVSDRSVDIEHIEFSRDGARFLTFTNGQLFIWDPRDFSHHVSIKTREGYRSNSGSMTIDSSSVPITSAFFSKDNKVVTGHEDGTIRVWNVATENEISRTKVGEEILFLNSASEGSTAIAVVADRGGKLIEKVDISTGSVIKRSKNIDISYPKKASVSPDTRFATVTGNIGETVICDLNDMKLRVLPYEYSGGDSIAFNKDGSTFFIGGDNQNLILYDTLNLKKLWQLIPDFEPSAAELKLDKEKDRRIRMIGDEKSRRDRQAAIDTKKYSKSITISFLHLGDMSDPGNKKMVESDKLTESKRTLPRKSANAAWFKLSNNSPLPIEIPTESMYLPDPKCFHQFPNGEKMFGSCGEREVGIRFGVKEKNGKWVPYGFDFGSSVILLPGSSVVFPVPLGLLDKNYRIVFDYSFQNVRASENDRDWGYGPKIEVSVDNSLLTK